MTYDEFCDKLDDVIADNADRYGDFGFGFDVEWSGGVAGDIMSDAKVTWPPVNLSTLGDAIWFAQALESACFEAAKLVGTEVAG